MIHRIDQPVMASDAATGDRRQPLRMCFESGPTEPSRDREGTVSPVSSDRFLTGAARKELPKHVLIHEAGVPSLAVGSRAASLPRRSRRVTLSDVVRWVGRIRRGIHSAGSESTRALVAAVDAKDPYTRVHSLAVAAYSGAIARRMRLPGRIVETVRSAALLHDIGKIGIPDAILTKVGPLTTEEFEVIKRHPELALEILGHVRSLRSERPVILHHHERYDGRGYPAGLAGDRIPLGARIIAVTDALDTMLSTRSYKQPYRFDQVRAELSVNSGRQFDPEVVAITLRWMDEWAAVGVQPDVSITA